MAKPLSEYNKKRNFGITSEPEGKAGAHKKQHLEFVIQKHGARRLHYDFRLELDGVMKSWAVTRGPSYNPEDKRLAVHVEDHPMEYNKFEGVIPDKQYGAGPVMIWDKGEWIPEGDPRKDLKKGRLTFQMKGMRMQGRWHLVRMHGKPNERRENWLLIKGDDEYVLKGRKNEQFLDKENISVISSRTLEEIKNNKKEKILKGKKPQKHKASKKFENLQKKYSSPELATLVELPPTGPDWWHEIKYDGYRIMAFIEDGRVILRTRGGKDWTHKFANVAKALAKLKVRSAVLDGELCVLDEKGVTSFSALQTALTQEDASRIEGWFFDLLYIDDQDLSKEALSKRKAALKKLLSSKKLSHIHYSDHFESNPDLLEKACKIGAEGLVSKNKNSAYHFRRTHDWVKSKCGQEQEFVIGGYMPAKDNPKAVGSLLLGYYKNKKLLYAGKVGTGFGQELARQLYKSLKPLELDKSPFEGKVEKSRRKHYWVKPETLCEVKFWEWTPDKHIRHASFKGLREDKAPKAVKREIPEKSPGKRKIKKTFTVKGITISHPEREVYPGTGITKGEIAEYYDRALPYILPFVENRLISLLRCTDGIEGQCFFQRNPMKGMGPDIYSKAQTRNGNKHNYLYIKNEKGFIELVQMNAIEFHAWQSHIDKINKPDQIIFDLDPAEGVPFEAVKLAAEDIRRRLKQMKLESFPRLSGGKGIHVVLAIEPKYSFDQIKDFSLDFAKTMERDMPAVYVANMSKHKRKGKIFIDYLRNDYSSTAIAPFSLRARPNAPIAVPLTWKELEYTKSSSAFNIKNIDKILGKKTERLIQKFFESRQNLKIN